MKLFGFDWPDIVRCQQFPRLAESMCIPPREKSTAVTCVPCEQAITLENIASSYCMADVVLKASVKDMVLQPNQASITLNLTPRTLALKLIRSDGTQLSSIDQYRRKRNSRRRRNNNFSNNNQDDDGTQHVYRPRAVRNLKVNMNTDNQYQSKYLIRPKSINFNEAKNWRSELKTKTKRRRKPRNSRLHDLDGITELILSCSSCNPLIPFTSGRLASSLSNQKWLVMGRRIQDSSTKKYTNQLQITFLGLWNRESAEFRQSLNAIRKEPVAHLCNKNQATLSAVIQPQSIRYHHPGRPLKILRSAPSELSDSPNYNELHNTLSVNKPLSSLSNQNIRSQSNNFHHYYRPEKSNKLGGYYQSKQTAYYNDSEYYLNNDLNSDKFKLNNGQTNYLNETNQLQSRQKTHRSSHRERRKKWKLNSNKMPSTTNPQSYQDSNSYQYVLPINPYSD
ncbi:hypothetical protein MN116_005520 [Schistosoma mekongi]|uniref:NTR domain-containing protein n=1 Tax=Schistosoma mekongi TaxID=38744 RepID=A0AAE1ZC10_SCHME|nr:hypothetical protein MN116_005520 [Schistosoma mekongi]